MLLRFKIALLLLISVFLGLTSGLHCIACQGTKDTPCDATPELITTNVRCNGTCLVRRTLFANGRTLRTIWRGCDTTIFPDILREDSRDACTSGNFFVECTSTCRGHLCNKLLNGIPWCWDCEGYLQPCTAESKSGAQDCPHNVEKTTPNPIKQIPCIGCVDGADSKCDKNPHEIEFEVPCNSSCITRRTLDKESRELKQVWRGCVDSLFPGTLSLEALDSCDESGEDVECTSTCDGRNCNKYASGFADCWQHNGRLKPRCSSKILPFVDDFGNEKEKKGGTTMNPQEARKKLFSHRRRKIAISVRSAGTSQHKLFEATLCLLVQFVVVQLL